MKAAFIEQTGPANVIVWGTLPKPEIGPSQVLVNVAAVSVNPIDTYIRSGAVPFELPRPYIIGSDLAGTVEAVGSAVTRFKPGDRVWGSNQGMLGRQGTFAEYAAVDDCWLYPIPEEVEESQAAALALVAITAHIGTVHKARVTSGDTVFVHGGSGGVGLCAIQMAKILGARVITSAGSEEKADLCRQYGADRVIQYRADDLDAALEQIVPEGVDVWWEFLREPNLEQIVVHMAVRGRIILVAGRDAKPSFPVGPFYTRDLSLFGFAMFNTPPEEQRKCAAEINRWMARGRLKAHIGCQMQLSQAAAAHQLQEENTLKKAGTLSGKIVLVP